MNFKELAHIRFLFSLLNSCLLSNASDLEFKAKIFQCIDVALGSLGKGVKESFYYQMKKRSNLTIDQFASRPSELIDALKEILGTSGFIVIEGLILREIRSACGIDFKANVTIFEAIQIARSNFLTSQSGYGDKN
jgi:hypothetical protein